jgi:CRISPR-associated protein Cas1
MGLEKKSERDSEVPARARHLPLRTPDAAGVPEYVPARMLNEILYCERLFFLEWVQGEFEDNAFTVEGRFVHRRVDRPSNAATHTRAAARPTPVGEGEEREADERPYEIRSLWLSDDALGLTAKIDLVEGQGDGPVVPIEYKRGPAPPVAEGAYLPERVQLCAQVLVLRANGFVCHEASVYFAASRKRVPITIDDELIAITKGAVERARVIARLEAPPPPLHESPKCDGCSLVGICLPDETSLLARLADERALEPSTANEPEAPFDPPDPWGLTPSVDEQRALRRLYPARDERLPLYVQEQGARVGLDGDRLLVRGRTAASADARLANTSQVSLFGNVQVSTQALKEVVTRGIPIALFTSGGYFLGRVVGHESKNVDLRIAQVRLADDPARSLAAARGLVAAKIRNARTMLRRNATGVDRELLADLERMARTAERATAAESLLGIEGTAARLYFGAFGLMLKGSDERVARFDFERRNRRPPRDPINALLSFVYAVLTKEFAIALAGVGLDPMVGVYHRPRFGRPSLALDLMEEFRPLLGDSTVINAVNTAVVDHDDFVTLEGSCALTADGRKKVIHAYERRMDQLVTHPTFGYKLSYRRVLEVQARLFTRFLLGEIDAYPSFRTR